MTTRKRYGSAFCLLLLTLWHQGVNGQEPVQVTGAQNDNRRAANDCPFASTDRPPIFTRVGIPAGFHKGSKAWFAYAQRNFDFGQVARKLADTTRPFRDSVVVRFIVTKDGQLCDFTTLRGNRILEDPVFALLRHSPPWQAAKAPTGSDVDAYRTLRVEIEIDFQQKRFTVLPDHNDFYRENDPGTGHFQKAPAPTAL